MSRVPVGVPVGVPACRLRPRGHAAWPVSAPGGAWRGAAHRQPGMRGTRVNVPAGVNGEQGQEVHGQV